MSSFGALTTAYTGLSVQARRIDVIGENIANSTTPGYRRRRVDLSAIEGPGSIGVFSGADRVGRGVQIDSIDRVIDPVLERHARTEAGRAASLQVGAEALNELELRWNAFAEGGIASRITDLGAAFDNLVNNPESGANRNLALNAAESLAQGIRTTAAEGVDVATSLAERAGVLVNRVNSLSASVASLDDSIRSGKAAGADIASLEDSRDRMIDELVSITNAQVSYDDRGSVRVSLDGHSLVSENQWRPIQAVSVPDAALPNGLDRLTIQAPDGRELRLTGGDLHGSQQAANVLIPDQLRSLDQFATDLADRFNAVHTTGAGADNVSGRNLFDASSGALGFAVHADVAGSPDAIAVAAAGAGTYDTTTAEALAAVVDAGDGPSAAWTTLTSNLAGLTASHRVRSEAASEAATSAEMKRISTSGVSLDEEMTDLIAAQRSYEASARVISTIDGMLDTLINRTGLVGR